MATDAKPGIRTELVAGVLLLLISLTPVREGIAVTVLLMRWKSPFAFLNAILSPLTFSITQGILWGFIAHAGLYLLAGRAALTPAAA